MHIHTHKLEFGFSLILFPILFFTVEEERESWDSIANLRYHAQSFLKKGFHFSFLNVYILFNMSTHFRHFSKERLQTKISGDKTRLRPNVPFVYKTKMRNKNSDTRFKTLVVEGSSHG